MKKLATLSLTLIWMTCCSITTFAETTPITPAQEHQRIVTEEASSKIQPRAIDEGELHELVFASSSEVELSDGSIWKIGLFWSASDWRSGEVIRITYVSSNIWYILKIENLSRNETVWSTGTKQIWDVNKKDTRKITAIQNGIFTLDDGKQYKIDTSDQYAYSWTIGDPVFVMGNQGNRDYHYFLINGIRKGKLVFDHTEGFYRKLLAEKV